MAAIRSVTIVGGGIGGLTLAVALRQIGVEVRIIEKGDRASRLGTGISLLGNALRALDRIGLADTCIARGYGYDCLKTRDAAGELLDEIALPRTFRPDRPGAFGIMRPVLAQILENEATSLGAAIDFETTVEDLEETADGVTLALSSGEKVCSDIVVGADGANSAMRERLFGTALKPEYCGQGGLRYTALRPAEMNGVTFYRDTVGNAVGAIPLSDEKCYYFILETGERPGHLSQTEVADLWQERVAGFSAPELVETVRHAHQAEALSYRPFDVLMMPRPWHKGRIVLIGDAVHSMSPQLTSGGGMAIEDAVVLAEEISAGRDFTATLARFENRREPRVRPILETSLAICRNEQNPSLAAHGKSMDLLQRGYALLADAF
ncbi:FAD-dependent monooxygenase [Croceicoccus bisphenolivorans]|uniref:FAD-dependent monooxygenase n=1 Tax=Croceicoccus bisphenolivorans TaxID=1783232 RepID=UPI00082CB9EF|nr:FAD-dependent monooxygenase [Croceicoccus bisphenolivorans]